MLKPIKVIDIEMSRPLVTLEGLDSYRAVKGLVRLHGKPIGSVDVPVIQGRCRAAALGKAILEQHGEAMLGGLLQDYLAAPAASGVDALQALLAARPPASPEAAPLVTVAVCTRDRAADISLCLDALMRLDYPALDILVVDNAPSTNATERLLREHYTQVRYVSEPRPGLDWARNRAIIEARGEIIAYTDDDVIVDSGWVRALVDVFTENPDVMAVTGLVVPHELETEAQILFEQYNGFGRGFERRWFRVDRESGQSAGALYGGSGQFGTGANMAYRRSVFAQIGHFDPALDVGTVTNGGGDLEMFFPGTQRGAHAGL